MLALAQRQPTAPGLGDYTAAGALFSSSSIPHFPRVLSTDCVELSPLSFALSISACFRNNRISNGKIRPALADFCVSRVIINMHCIIVYGDKSSDMIIIQRCHMYVSICDYLIYLCVSKGTLFIRIIDICYAYICVSIT